MTNKANKNIITRRCSKKLKNTFKDAMDIVEKIDLGFSEKIVEQSIKMSSVLVFVFLILMFSEDLEEL